MRSLLVLVASLVSIAAFTLPVQPALVRSAGRSSTPSLVAPDSAMLLLADAVPMADGAYTVMFAGGLVAILTAGIPILFLSGKDKADDPAAKMAGLEQGLEDVEITDLEMEGMEVVDEPAEAGVEKESGTN